MKIPMTLSQHRATIDPSISAADGKDHLSALPAELLHHIIGYLFPTHVADKAFHYHARCAHPTRHNNHDLDYLAATSKHLRSSVNDWARSWLQQHSSITKFKEGRIWPKATTKRNGVVQMRKNFMTNYLRGRNGALLNWMDACCIFCGKKSRRSAIMMNGLRCCSGCDKKEWTDKMTMSQAIDEYGLQKYQLVPAREATRDQRVQMIDAGIPIIWYGTYHSLNVATTMFMKSDVRRLTEAVFGEPVDVHLAKREEQKQKVKKSREEGKRKRAGKAAQKARDQAREAQLNAAAAALARQELRAARWPDLQQQTLNPVENFRCREQRSANKVIEIPDDDDEMETEVLSELFGEGEGQLTSHPIVID